MINIFVILDGRMSDFSNCNLFAEATWVIQKKKEGNMILVGLTCDDSPTSKSQTFPEGNRSAVQLTPLKGEGLEDAVPVLTIHDTRWAFKTCTES